MANPALHAAQTAPAQVSAITESRPWRWALMAIAFGFLGIFLALPLALVFMEAFRKGLEPFFTTLTDHDTIKAIQLTLTVAAISVPLNCIFGVAAAWAVAKYEFRGKAFLTTLIDLPFSVSPVISGLVYVLLFGSSSLLGPWLKSHGGRILLDVPCLVMGTIRDPGHLQRPQGAYR